MLETRLSLLQLAGAKRAREERKRLADERATGTRRHQLVCLQHQPKQRNERRGVLVRDTRQVIDASSFLERPHEDVVARRRPRAGRASQKARERRRIAPCEGEEPTPPPPTPLPSRPHWLR